MANIPIWGCTTQQKEAAHSILAPAMTLSMAIPLNPPTGRLWKAAQVLCVMTVAPSSRAEALPA